MMILGVDPGQTTGVCILDVDGDKAYGVSLVLSDQLCYGEASELDFLILTPELEVVVMESAVHHGKITSGKVYQLKVMGAVEYLCSIYGIPLEYITPEQRKLHTKVPDEIKGPHAKDAYRLAATYILKQRGLLGIHDDFILTKDN